ncbi:3'-5' exonuclease [Mitsuokella sp.]|uniref:3'-5' exonuclease n=1 Tax=Mitsuokella TaxID=52225 RepID=UPI002A7FB97A|nr:3'-5' exonuclease [Mitsuokella sp.]MDY4474466.1 3'-5' exonuclease [Mitsuokella sp.]
MKNEKERARQERLKRQRRRKKQLERAIRAQAIHCDRLASLHPTGIVSFDLELAGPFPDDIIEIGALRLDLSTDTVECFQRLCRPRTFINRTVQDMTGLLKEDLRHEKTLPETLPGFLDFVRPDDIVVGHAIGDNDLLSINLALLRINRDQHTEICFYPRYLDTVRLAQQFLPKNHKYNLEVLLESFGWQNREKHRALADAVASYVLLQELLELGRCKPAWLPDLMTRRGGPELVHTYLKRLPDA